MYGFKTLYLRMMVVYPIDRNKVVSSNVVGLAENITHNNSFAILKLTSYLEIIGSYQLNYVKGSIVSFCIN